MTEIAQWLNTTFANFDHSIFAAFQSLHESPAETVLTPFFNFISFLGNEGIAIMILGFILMLFKKTRKAGAVMIGGVGIGTILTNFIAKPVVARPRPFANTEWDVYQWWVNAGKHIELDTSFPSGHTTAAMGSMTALFFVGDKRYSWTAFFFVLLMGMSRIYMFVHYPSDILGAVISGFVAGFISAMIGNWFYKRNDWKFNKFIIEFDVFKIFKKA